MSGKYLLDTNIVINILDDDAFVLSRIPTVKESCLSTTVLGELHFGAQNSGRVGHNLSKLEKFASAIVVLPTDEQTARVYGIVRKALKTIGKPIPENDIWIAAIAIQHDLTLITFDQHFEHVQDLKLERWSHAPDQ
jgi:tRNA(fMet)-specific endonuclease VapC